MAQTAFHPSNHLLLSLMKDMLDGSLHVSSLVQSGHAPCSNIHPFMWIFLDPIKLSASSSNSYNANFPVITVGPLVTTLVACGSSSFSLFLLAGDRSYLYVRKLLDETQGKVRML